MEFNTAVKSLTINFFTAVNNLIGQACGEIGLKFKDEKRCWSRTYHFKKYDFVKISDRD
jgi:hypothetical protein